VREIPHNDIIMQDVETYFLEGGFVLLAFPEVQAGASLAGNDSWSASSTGSILSGG
jgi:hypothetical protein